MAWRAIKSPRPYAIWLSGRARARCWCFLFFTFCWRARRPGVITRAAAWVKLSHCHLNITRRARGIYGSNCHLEKHVSNCHGFLIWVKLSFRKTWVKLSFVFCYGLFPFCVGIFGGGRENLGQIVKLSHQNNRTVTLSALTLLYKYTNSQYLLF